MSRSSVARTGSRRREVLDVLRAAPGPLGVAEAAERIGVHPNTVRFHLEGLVREGLVAPRAQAASGPGRPRTVYAALPGPDRGGTRRYRLLAQMLLGRLAADGPRARSAAMETGRVWGRSLIGAAPPQPPGPEESVARLVGLLDDLGFAPDPDGADDANNPDNPDSAPGAARTRIRLRHCPFLELAEEYRELVCPLHLALLQGALAELRAPLTATDLEPFAEPGACLAHLAPQAPGAPRQQTAEQQTAQQQTPEQHTAERHA
jgi:predicted ArsR family transcriptional regulator